jgi:translation initiation factor IF-2
MAKGRLWQKHQKENRRMTTPTKTPRLLEAAKEFNIGRETLITFLTDKGFQITSNPAAKLTEQMYNALQVEFAQDKAAKRKSDEVALPKGSLLDGFRKTKEDLDITAKDKKEEPAIADPKKDKPAVAEKAKAPEVKEEPAKKAAPAAAKEEAPKKAATPAADKEEAPAKKTVAKTEEIAKKTTKSKDIVKDTEAADAPEHLDMKSPKIEGPNILGKINLDDMNLASRPKKGAVKKKEAKKEDAEVTDETKAAKPAKAKKEAKAKEVPPLEIEVPEKDITPEEDNNGKPEHIEMKAPKLEGPKIIGRIELPVSQPSGNSGRPDNRIDNREKRKRKRIPVEKKPETHKPDPNNRDRNQPPGQGGPRTPGAPPFNRERRPSGPQTGPGHGGPGGPRHGGSGGGNFRPGGRDGGDRRGAPSRNVPATAQQQEIDTKAIQDKIRETQAKLTGSTRSKNLKAKYRRNKRDEMADKRAAAENAEQTNVIQVTEFISVSELASLLNVSFADVISKCMSLGIMVSINQRLDAEVIELVSSEFNYEVEFINLEQEAEEEIEDVDDEADLLPRAPIVTIMGHVDHGKTSLLDYIRSANVVAGEAGGITQHIGAYQVTTATGKRITFLDTPGHEAFTAMRARGAKVADVAVIVIAADDAIMPQTKEAISHAQAANLPMIFAINKIDKEGANPEKIKEQLANMNILVEDWGGKFQSQEISAKKGLNVDLLLEKIGLEAELLELKANPDRNASGSVIEASLDKGRGYQSTILVQNGTLNQGDMIACGQHYGKIKAMFNERGQRVTSAGPSAPVQVLGLNGAPQAGEKFRVFENEDEAKDLANHRAQIMREQGIRARKHITLDEIGRRLALGNFKELGVIIKGDFDGSVEALSDSLQKLSTEEVAINVVHKGVGQITESDVLLATASDAIIIGFQVRPSMQAAKLADQENIEIRTYSIIYDAIEEIKSAMEGLLEPKVEKKTVCNIEVREVFKISGVGTIAGCYVLDGKMTRQTKLNLIRDGIVVYNGELASLKRFKDDVKDVNAGYECGLSIKNYNDVRAGDIIEGYEEVEVKRTL